MGITKLADLIRLNAPDAISHKDIIDYSGNVADLASISLFYFHVFFLSVLSNIKGSTSSPLTGLFFRTLTFLEHDIKPVFVFDGKPPKEKAAVCNKLPPVLIEVPVFLLQLEKRAHAAGWRSANRTGAGTTSSQTTDCLQLLKLLGVPVVQAPGDAEALCAWLVKQGTADAVASEDMDTLPFGGNILIRQLNAKKDSEVVEYSLNKLLEKLQISHEEFVDLCILLGCDYCDKIAGLGPRRALTLIQKHRTIENVVLHVNRKTHPVPQFWGYKEARKIFLDAPQTEAPELSWTEPDEEALVGFLCHVKRVKEDRVRSRMENFRQTREQGRSRQTRMEDFFRVTRKREQSYQDRPSGRWTAMKEDSVITAAETFPRAK
uniref:Zgc:110269 n=1 Tax=Gasterosteus aculeatus TaxID=69293 RepID=G3PT40_GASAC